MKISLSFSINPWNLYIFFQYPWKFYVYVYYTSVQRFTYFVVASLHKCFYYIISYCYSTIIFSIICYYIFIIIVIIINNIIIIVIIVILIIYTQYRNLIWVLFLTWASTCDANIAAGKGGTVNYFAIYHYFAIYTILLNIVFFKTIIFFLKFNFH